MSIHKVHFVLSSSRDYVSKRNVKKNGTRHLPVRVSVMECTVTTRKRESGAARFRPSALKQPQGRVPIIYLANCRNINAYHKINEIIYSLYF